MPRPAAAGASGVSSRQCCAEVVAHQHRSAHRADLDAADVVDIQRGPGRQPSRRPGSRTPRRHGGCLPRASTTASAYVQLASGSASGESAYRQSSSMRVPQSTDVSRTLASSGISTTLWSANDSAAGRTNDDTANGTATAAMISTAAATSATTRMRRRRRARSLANERISAGRLASSRPHRRGVLGDPRRRCARHPRRVSRESSPTAGESSATARRHSAQSARCSSNSRRSAGASAPTTYAASHWAKRG